MRIQRFVLLASFLVAVGCGSFGNGTGSPGGLPDESGSESGATSVARGLDLPAGTNAIVTVGIGSPSSGTLTLETTGGTAEITTALLGLQKIQLKTPEMEDEDAAEEACEDPLEEQCEIDCEDPVDEAAEDACEMTCKAQAELACGETENDEEELEIELKGPFVVDLVNLTVENLGPSRIDDDADDDGVEDVDDPDDDNDGVADADDVDDDNDGMEDEEDRLMGEIEIFDALELPAGVFRRIRAQIHKIETEDGIDPTHPLAGKSLLVEGTVGGQSFRVAAEFGENLEAESREGITVDDTSIAVFVLSFNPASWFDGIDLTTAEKDADGVAVIDEDHNEELLDRLRDNVKASAEMEEGIDDDVDEADDEADEEEVCFEQPHDNPDEGMEIECE